MQTADGVAGLSIPNLLGSDPVPWLLDSDEPYARWVTLTSVIGTGPSSPGAEAARAASLADPHVQGLITELPRWGEVEDVSGHHSPAYLPNRLNLLADLGVRAADSPLVAEQLDSMLEHQEPTGRFQSLGKLPHRPRPEWGSLLCDTNVITDVLIRMGRGDDPRVHLALKRIADDVSATAQGKAWLCIPEKRSLFRGPGRKGDVCPQVTLEGLRAWSHEPGPRPKWLLEIARIPLEIWRRRADERPYAFGHGYQFKSVKWPNFWYDVLWVLETVSRFPELWRGDTAHEEDRRAIAELAACLIDYNFDEHGCVIPRRAYRGFERFSFGQKREPSPFATALCLVPLTRVLDLAEEIRAVDVTHLGSSKGGSGTAVPPKGRAPQLCPVSPRLRTYPLARAVPRVLARHHLGTPWQQASIESVVADIVGLHATSATTPYLSAWARLPGTSKEAFERALYDRRSLVRMRCMRGTVFIVRRDLVTAVFASTRRQTIRYAREYASFRGVTDDVFERFAPQVTELIGQEGALTTAGVRNRLGFGPKTQFDVAALVNRMTTEGLLLRDRPHGSWADRQWTYELFEKALPEIRLNSMSEEDADVVVVRYYLRGFGPVTRKDVSWWTGIGPKRTQRALEELGDEIVEVSLEGTDEVLLMHAADVDEIESAAFLESPHVELLPSLDPFVMGFARREWYVPAEYREYVFDRAGNAAPVILAEGRVIGVWDVEREPRPGVMIHFFARPSDEVSAVVESRAQLLGRFWHDADAGVRRVLGMRPLPDRPAGAVMKPLRA